ncbi:hypothetical protein Csa_023708, partial [Cucumis sativus]
YMDCYLEFHFQRRVQSMEQGIHKESLELYP